MGSGYLLDTNIVSRLGRKRPPIDLVQVLEKRSDVFLSTITVEELCFGVLKAPQDAQEKLQSFIDGLGSFHLHPQALGMIS